MSIPPHYSRRQAPPPPQPPGGGGIDALAPSGGTGASVGVEDCRDYLRTGRCKYGSSCKYNHPPNVQSGGGMKAPIDPSEPMFPVRPNEPVCQYYMKHGTCKFGQACKFHHPPQTPLQAVMNGSGAVMMNVGDIAHQLVLNPVGTDTSGTPTTMMVQFLPQRPDEPDCIYYLKNGRCKYGTTCRYHHPVNLLNKRRLLDESRQQQLQRPNPSSLSSASTARVTNPDPYRMQKIQYVTSAQSLPGYSSQGGPDVGPISFLHLDGTAMGQSFQPIPIISTSDGTTAYGLPVTPTEPASSASSLASSYDTVGSSLEQQWNRVRRNGSGGSLNAYSSSAAVSATGVSASGSVGGDVNSQVRSQQQRPPVAAVLHNSASDGSIATRSTRGTSLGSASEMLYYDSVSSLPRNPSVGSWRTDRSSSSLDHSRLVHSSQFQTRQDSSSNATRSPQMRGQVPVVQVAHSPQRMGPSRGGRRSNDEGFTRMTSALLNMLDTPEEAFAYDDDESRLSHASYPLSSDQYDQVDPAFFERLSLHHQPPLMARASSSSSSHRDIVGKSSSSVDNNTSQWSPSLRSSYVGIGGGEGAGAGPMGLAAAPPSNESLYHSAAHSHHLQQQQHHHQQRVLPQNAPLSGTSSGADIGFYLP